MRVLRMGDIGSDVMEIQATLKKLGYEIGPIDGVFGPQTLRAVTDFQVKHELTPDGIIGEQTMNALAMYMEGAAEYTVRPGDTIYLISGWFGVGRPFIQAANPGVDLDALQPGDTLHVPFGYDVVDTNIQYTYAVLSRDLVGLKIRYPFLDISVAGKSVLGKDLYLVKLGEGQNQVFYNASHHALEWITTPVLMKYIEQYAKAYVSGGDIGNFSARDLFGESSIFIMPMVNPDGVDLVIDGLQPGNPYAADLVRWNNGSTDFSTNWQANIRGVDLNHNYDAGWEASKAAARELGITGPGPTRYGGETPESEPETKTVSDFTRTHDFRLVMAYHSQGEVIYWNFENLAPPEGLVIGRELAAISRYALGNIEGIASYAGYKDWFIQEYRRPGYTIEVGRGKNPLPISQFDKIYADNVGMLSFAARR